MDELILKCLQGEATELEQQQVWYWLKDEANFAKYQKLRDTWIASGVIQRNSSFEIERRYQKVQARIHEKIQLKPTFQLFSKWSTIWKIAAVFLIAFVLGSLVTQFTSLDTFTSSGKNQYKIEAPMGAIIKMSLADGTKVWLNAGSKLTYSNAYNVKNRKVSLVGEGYFEVAKNKKIPFYVDANGVKVKAVGTAFNVKAYPDEKRVEATLVEGIIDITDGNQTYRLAPRQKASIIRNLPQLIDNTNSSGSGDLQQVNKKDINTVDVVISKNINTDIYTSWIRNRWIFEREKLSDFTKILERRYDVRIYVMDPKLNDYKITGSIEQQTLEQLLNAVRLTVPIKYRITNKEVILTLDKRLENEYKMLMKRP